MLVDPCLEEEQVMEGRLVVGMNVHREVCVLQMSGGVPILPEQVCGVSCHVGDHCIKCYACRSSGVPR